MKTYAAIYDHELRHHSSSGGLFSLIASGFIDRGGIVYGVVMDDDFYGAHFERAESQEDLSKMRGSKYLQAKTGDIFKSVRNDLKKGKQVLFTGTGCQINGLKAFLMKEYDNLTCIDVLCHGVPSPKLWEKYARHLEKKHGPLSSVNFRRKEKSGIQNENSLYQPMKKDPYMRMFLRDYALRPSCYNCVIKPNKKSDITLGDFWGIEKIVPELNDALGASLVVCRSEKGERIFDSVKDQLKYMEVSYEDGVKYNPSDYRSSPRPKERDTFFKDLNQIDFEELAEKYAADPKIPVQTRLKQLVKSAVKKAAGTDEIMEYGLETGFRKEEYGSR